jgi:pimeloyl-ACP methyl ester carboxylesterase
VAWAGAHAGRVRDRIAAAALVSTGVGDLVSESLVVAGAERFGRPREALTRALLSSRVPLPTSPTPISHRVVRYVALSRSASPAMVAFCERIVLECRRDARADTAQTLSELDLREAVEALDVPTAVLAGECDRLTPPVHARQLAEALPHVVDHVELPGAGHMTPVERGEEVTGLIRALARDHARTPVAR